MLTFRKKLKASDLSAIQKIASSTGFFEESDVRVNVSLAEKVFYDHDKSYEFILADFNGETAAYVCYGLLPDAAPGTYEIFWLSTLNQYRGCGIGRQMLEFLFDELKRRGGRRLYLKTDGISQYQPTRRFYEKCGFVKQAELKGYYSSGDNCCIYARELTEENVNDRLRYSVAAE